jgi:hypothetical protein
LPLERNNELSGFLGRQLDINISGNALIIIAKPVENGEVINLSRGIKLSKLNAKLALIA